MALDPVVEEALQDLSDWTFNKRGRWYEYYKRPPMTLVDGSSRSYAIHTFMGLMHHGYAFDPQAILHWAEHHGWPQEEAILLSDYAAGVSAGIRYHTHPSPFGLLDIDDLRSRASLRPPGRPWRRQRPRFTLARASRPDRPGESRSLRTTAER